jgi:hypothetical protein
MVMTGTVMIPIPTMKTFQEMWLDIFGEDYTPERYQTALARNDARLDTTVTMSGKTINGDQWASSATLRNIAEIVLDHDESVPAH